MYQIDCKNRVVYRDEEKIELPKSITKRHWDLIEILVEGRHEQIIQFGGYDIEGTLLQITQRDTTEIMRSMREFLKAIGNWEPTDQRIFQIVPQKGYRINCRGQFCVIRDGEYLLTKTDAEWQSDQHRSWEISTTKVQIPTLRASNTLSTRVDSVASTTLHYYEALWEEFNHPDFRDQELSQYLEFFDSYIELFPRKTENPNQHFQGFLPRSKNLILSPSGFGKTYLLQCLTLLQVYGYLLATNSNKLSVQAKAKKEYCEALLKRFAPEGAYFPVHIKCGDIHKKGQYEQIWQLAEQYCYSSELEFSSMLREAYKSDKLLLLIDAFDEIVDEDTKKVFRDKLEAFTKTYPRATIVITDRYEDRMLKLGYSVYELPSFQMDEIAQLARKLLASSEDKCNEMLGLISANPYLFEIAQNPYMATVMFSMKSSAKELTPINCLHKISDGIIQFRWKEDTIDGIVGDSTIKEILGYLAWNLILQEKDGIAKNDLVFLMIQARDELNKGKSPEEREHIFSVENIKKYANVIMCSSGIINLNDKGRFIFQSNILCSYFAASYLVCVIKNQLHEDGRLYPNVIHFENFIGLNTVSKYSQPLMQTLAMAVAFEGNGEPWVETIPLICLLWMGASVKSKSECELVVKAVVEIVRNVYNINSVTNTDADYLCSMLLFFLEKYASTFIEKEEVSQCVNSLRERTAKVYEEG